MIKLIIGEQSLYLKSILNKIVNDTIKQKDDFNYGVFDFEVDPLTDILDFASSFAFTSQNKVTIVKNPFFLQDKSKQKVAFTNDYTLLENYILDDYPNNLLIILCPKKYYNQKNKLITLIKNKGEIIDLSMDSKDELNNYAKAIIENSKIDIEPKALALFLSRCADIITIENELAKLSLYKDTITEEIVESLIPIPLEENVFELSNAILNKNSTQVMNIYNDLKKLKIEPITLIGLLANQFRLILQVAILRKNKKSDKEMEELLKIHPYRIKLAKDYSKKYSLNEVKQILIDLSNLDYEIKKGTKDRYIDFELFLATKSS